MNEDKEIVPWLIQEWNVADDGVTWTFKLAEGAQFTRAMANWTRKASSGV